MLRESASQYYFDACKEKCLTLDELASTIRSRFHTAERTRALLREWEILSLPVIIEGNIGKSASQCLELLITRLSDIRVSPPLEYRRHDIEEQTL